MLLILTLLAAASAAPVTYDQRQDGEFNVQADVQNVVLLFAIPQKMPLDTSILADLFTKSAKGNSPEIQERSDFHMMEAFVEPATPYQVDISEEARTDARAVDVVIAGRRSGGGGVDADEDDDMKLLGATEQCGPGRVRDPHTLACKDEAPTPLDDIPPQLDQTD